MVNVLEPHFEDVAIGLGHTDGVELVSKLYGLTIASVPSIE